MSITTSDFNQNHPESREGEVFLTNLFFVGKFDIVVPDEWEPQLGDISYTTKRRGSVAYTTDGNVIYNAYPVFVDKTEYATGPSLYQLYTFAKKFKRFIFS